MYGAQHMDFWSTRPNQQHRDGSGEHRTSHKIKYKKKAVAFGAVTVALSIVTNHPLYSLHQPLSAGSWSLDGCLTIVTPMGKYASVASVHASVVEARARHERHAAVQCRSHM
jgi:hypothetical protein